MNHTVGGGGIGTAQQDHSSVQEVARGAAEGGGRLSRERLGIMTAVWVLEYGLC